MITSSLRTLYFGPVRTVPSWIWVGRDIAEYLKKDFDGGQRVGTLIMYLKEPERGGSTYFANLGQRIFPRKGSALFFGYAEAKVSNGTLHGGDPVISGEKWIATKWFRERATSCSDTLPQKLVA